MVRLMMTSFAFSIFFASVAFIGLEGPYTIFARLMAAICGGLFVTSFFVGLLPPHILLHLESYKNRLQRLRADDVERENILAHRTQHMTEWRLRYDVVQPKKKKSFAQNWLGRKAAP